VREEMVAVLIVRIASMIVILIMSSGYHNKGCDHGRKMTTTMVVVLIMNSSPHNKDWDHEDCNQAVLTKSQSQSRSASKSKSKSHSQLRSASKSKSHSKFSQSHSC